MNSETPEARSDFVRRIVAEDNESGKYDGRVHTRFPPSPTATFTLDMPSRSA